MRSDLYGVGAMLWEMLTGERPSESASMRPSGVHRELSALHDAAVLRLIATSQEDRPPDAFTARRELLALRWPRDVEPAALPARQERRASEHPTEERLEVDPSTGRCVDRWAARPVDRVPLTDVALARAGAFARAGHPALQAVLRVDREGGCIWLDAPRGRRLDRHLAPAELAQLRQALVQLHGEGATHGSVDAEHVVLGDAGPYLRFRAIPQPHASADTDFAELARLAPAP